MKTLIIAALLAAPVVAHAAETPPAKKPTNKQWTLKGDLGETPKRLNDDWPLSDQANRAGWAKFEPMWDEHDAARLPHARRVAALERGRRMDGALAAGRRLPCVRPGVDPSGTPLVRRRPAGAHGREHALAATAPHDLRQRDYARLVRHAQ